VIVDMFARDERHDNLYFLKEVSPETARALGIEDHVAVAG
jgi:hypothetical protein